MGPLDVLGSLQTQAEQAIRRRLEFLALHEFSVTSGTLLLLSGPHDALPSIKWEQEYSPRFPPFRGGGGGGRGEDRKENYSEAWPRLNSLQFRAAQRRAPPSTPTAPGPFPRSLSRWLWRSAPTPFLRAQAPPWGRSRRAARRLAAQHSGFLSPHRQPRLGEGRTDRGREPPGQGSGELVSSSAAPPPCCALPLDTAGHEDGGAGVVPASDSLAGGVWGALAKGGRLKIIGGWGGWHWKGGSGEGCGLGWGRSLGSCAPTTRLAHWQVVGWGRHGPILGWTAGISAVSGLSGRRLPGSVMPGIGSNNQHQTVSASSLPARHGGAAPSRGGSRSPKAAAARRERSCLGGKGPQGRRIRVPPHCEIPLTAPTDPRETPRVVVPAERGRPASPKGRRAPAAECRAPRTLRSSGVPRSDSSGRSAPERLEWAQTRAARSQEGAQGGLPKVSESAQAELPRRPEWRAGRGRRSPPSLSLMQTPSFPLPPPPIRARLHWRC